MSNNQARPTKESGESHLKIMDRPRATVARRRRRQRQAMIRRFASEEMRQSSSLMETLAACDIPVERLDVRNLIHSEDDDIDEVSDSAAEAEQEVDRTLPQAEQEEDPTPPPQKGFSKLMVAVGLVILFVMILMVFAYFM